MRLSVAAVITLWLAPVFAVGVHAFWPVLAPSLLLGAAFAAAAAALTTSALTATIAPALRARALAVLVALLAAAAIAQIAMISVYMGDPARVGWSYMRFDPFRTRHSCMTAYAEAIRFCAQPDANIYDMTLYEPRMIGPLKVDSFHYPPPFLLLPAAVHAVRADLFQFRAIWFVMQCVVLAGAVFGLARWIGGTAGAYAAAGGVLAFASPQFVYSLQQGNVQSTAMPIAVVALILLCTRRLALGGTLLAYIAAAKIFPGVLLVYLAGARRWRALAATAAGGVAVIVLTLMVFGPRPFKDFLTHELPRISSGAAFPQTEFANTMNMNVSVYGLTTRLRALGWTFLDQRRGLAVASVYGLMVIALAAFAGWRQRVAASEPAGRLRLARMALALLLLASFRSPFVGFYGYVAFIWLMTLLAAEARTTLSLAGWWGATALFGVAHATLPSPNSTPTAFDIGIGLLLFCIALTVCVVTVARTWRGIPAQPAARAYVAAIGS